MSWVSINRSLVLGVINRLWQTAHRSIEAALNLGFPVASRWRWLSLIIPLYYGLCTWFYASQPNVVQDDARQHVAFWGQLIDPARFALDPIADYFQAVAPIGYRALYGGLAQLGIEPLSLAQVLPIGLGIITSLYIFEISVHFLPVPLNGLLSVLILNQQLWMDDSLCSGTPRAFVYPIFAAFLYYYLRQNLILCLTTLALQGLFFPQLVLVQLGVLLLRCLRWIDRRLRLSRSSFDYRLAIGGIITAVIVLSPYLLDSSVGAAITLDQMRPMPEYGLHGRNEYFGVNFWQFWLLGNSGLRIPWFPSLSLLGFGLPLLLTASGRSRWPMAHAVRSSVVLLGQGLVASLLLFGCAHGLLLKLHFPSRYTYHTLRLGLALAAAMVITIGLAAIWQQWHQRIQTVRLSSRQIGQAGLGITLALIVTLVPALPPLFYQFQGWVSGADPLLYDYLATQPPSLIASILPEANNLPALAQQSTLTGREFALPHHPRYYQLFQQRTIDALRLLYSSDPDEVVRLIDRYGVDFLLIEASPSPSIELLQQDWLIHSIFQNIVQDVIDRIRQDQRPVILGMTSQCTAMSTDQFLLLEATCIKYRLIAQSD